MKKELCFSKKLFELIFYYDEEMDLELLESYGASLSLLCQAFETFKNIHLEITDFQFNLNINICDDQTMIDLNSKYREKEKITDVLSFPLQENIRNGEYDSFSPEIELGDIFVCESVCAKQAGEFNVSFQDEFIHLCTHGFLHVLGYDHEESADEEKLMEDLEGQIVGGISKNKKGQ